MFEPELNQTLVAMDDPRERFAHLINYFVVPDPNSMAFSWKLETGYDPLTAKRRFINYVLYFTGVEIILYSPETINDLMSAFMDAYIEAQKDDMYLFRLPRPE